MTRRGLRTPPERARTPRCTTSGRSRSPDRCRLPDARSCRSRRRPIDRIADAGDVELFVLAVRRTRAFAVPVGWLVTVGGNVNRRVSPILEAGANYRPDRGGTLWNLLGAGRCAVRGAAIRRHSRSSLPAWPAVAAGHCCGDIRHPARVRPGGGVDIPFSRRSSVQIAVGLLLVADEGHTSRVLRVTAGVSLAVGE
jgi:hypothetical protein